jgi:hypothetical protein
MKTVLSFGLGVESSTILLRWLSEPEARDFDLDDLIVLTAMTGQEFPDTVEWCERHVLPRLGRAGVRYVQIARAGRREADGVAVLSDTTSPDRLHADGAYRLDEELLSAGTVPQFGGEHRCALKFKAFPAEAWAAAEFSGGQYRLVFGYNRDEQRRVEKARRYDGPGRVSRYPLAEWGWDRRRCAEYLAGLVGAPAPKSCCVWCPFYSLGEQGVGRMRKFPEEMAHALMIERMSLTLNPRGTLYKGRSLYEVLERDGQAGALGLFGRRLGETPHALYRVRRIYKKPGQADRAVEKLAAGSRAEMARLLEQVSRGMTLRIEHGISYAWVRERGSEYPALEELYVVGPAFAETKTRHGFDRFDRKWDALSGRDPQGSLF